MSGLTAVSLTLTKGVAKRRPSLARTEPQAECSTPRTWVISSLSEAKASCTGAEPERSMMEPGRLCELLLTVLQLLPCPQLPLLLLSAHPAGFPASLGPAYDWWQVKPPSLMYG